MSGEFYGGSATLSFHDEDRAFEFVHRAKHAPINVSVRPNKPEESTITQEQLELAESALLRSTQPNQIEQNDFALPDAARSLLFVFMWVAAAGAVGNVIIHLGALAGRMLVSPTASLVFAFSSILLLLPSWLADLWLGKVQAHGRKSAPPAIRYAVYFFWIVSGSYYLAGEYLTRPIDPVFKLQAAASLGAFFYASVLAGLYPATQARKACQPAVAAVGNLVSPKA